MTARYDAPSMGYDHAQKAPLYLILLVVAAGEMVAGAVVVKAAPAGAAILWGCAALMVLLAFCFRQLRVSDAGDHLRIAFGPIPLFFRRVPYASIKGVEKARSSWLHGWGIHGVPGRGSIWNLWGFGCVKLRLDGRVLMVGTDDVDGLAAFLAGKIGGSRP